MHLTNTFTFSQNRLIICKCVSTLFEPLFAGLQTLKVLLYQSYITFNHAKVLFHSEILVSSNYENISTVTSSLTSYSECYTVDCFQFYMIQHLKLTRPGQLRIFTIHLNFYPLSLLNVAFHLNSLHWSLPFQTSYNNRRGLPPQQIFGVFPTRNVMKVT